MSALKVFIGTALCHPIISAMISAAFKGRIPSQGFIFDTNSKYIPRCNAASIFWGLYERKEIYCIRRFLRANLDVIELGSSLGVTTIHIVAVQERARKLICVEANPYLIKTIQNNVTFNAPWKKAEIINRAIDYSGQMEVNFTVGENNLGSHISDVGGDQMRLLKTITLRKLLDDYQIKDFALVSDIEGAEAGIIINDAEALTRCWQMIIELHPIDYEGRAYSVDELREKIETFHGFRLTARHHGLHVFERASTH